jgi:hypothetical protein
MIVFEGVRSLMSTNGCRRWRTPITSRKNYGGKGTPYSRRRSIQLLSLKRLRTRRNMYDLINRNITRLLETVKRADDIDPYIWMIRELHLRDVSQNQEFQQRYSSYWALNGAGLGRSFRAAYFALLNQAKCSPEQTTVDGITRALYEVPVNAKGKNAIQFSFASKLVHMINPRSPVYDRMVESFYFLPRSYTGTSEKKLANLLRSYRFLVGEYDRILREGLLAPAINELRRHFEVPADYSDQKTIDTLIWKFIPFLESGAVRDGSVVYR